MQEKSISNLHRYYFVVLSCSDAKHLKKSEWKSCLREINYNNLMQLQNIRRINQFTSMAISSFETEVSLNDATFMDSDRTSKKIQCVSITKY